MTGSILEAESFSKYGNATGFTITHKNYWCGLAWSHNSTHPISALIIIKTMWLLNHITKEAGLLLKYERYCH